VISSLRPLRSRNFALVWSSAMVSNVGSWMQTVALGVLVQARTGNPLWSATAAALAFLPLGLLSPVGGALADRFDRRRWLMATTLAEALCAAGLALLAGPARGPVWALVVVAFLGGACAAVGFPAYQAMVPDLVPPEDLLGAVSLSSAQFNLGRVIGPALAALVLVAASPGWAFAINAVSFGAVVGALAAIRLPARASTTAIGWGLVRRIVDGARVAAAEPGCRSAIVLIATVALIGSPFIALVPAVAYQALHLARHQAGAATAVLVTAQGVGAVVGALAQAPLAATLGRRRVLVGSLGAFPVALSLYGVAPSLAWAALAITVVGACYIGVLSGLNTVVQLHAPASARGRVLGLYMMALGTIYPVGAVVEGALARIVGIRAVTVVAGLVLAGVMASIGALYPRLFGALGDPPVRSSAASDATAPSATDVADSFTDPGAPAVS
jgi:MFS family permease